MNLLAHTELYRKKLTTYMILLDPYGPAEAQISHLNLN